MMSFGGKVRTAVLGATLMLGASATANAQPGQVVWNFQGNCIDCAAAAGLPSYQVTAALTLQDYTQGTQLADANFVSFSYSGSNLMKAYVVDYVGGPSSPPYYHAPGLEDFISGTLQNGGFQSFSLSFGDALEFTMDSNGNWFTCGTNGTDYYDVPCSWAVNNDFGVGSFRIATTNVVPEPGTWALMAVGLAGLGLAARRRVR